LSRSVIVSWLAAFAGKPDARRRIAQSNQTRPCPHDDPSFSLLPPRYSRLTSIKKENIYKSPQVEGLDNRHSTNRTINPVNNLLAKLQEKAPTDDCPFDCDHGIANTHGNLMLPARNKE
jgi:hypothetical protein